MRLAQDPVAPVQSEQVARLEHQGPDLEIAALAAFQLVRENPTPAAAEHGHLQPPSFHRKARGRGQQGVARQQVLDEHPGDRRPAVVL